MNPAKKSVFMLLAVFILPVVFGSMLYFNKELFGVRTAAYNYGELIHPARPLNIADLQQQGKSADLVQVLHKKWTLMYFSPQVCAEACHEKLSLMKTIRLLMNEHMRRVRTLVVMPAAMTDTTVYKQQYPDLEITYTEVTPSRFAAQFPDLKSGTLYLVDPLGNLMMQYPQQQLDVKAVLKDLKRLFKYSRIG